MKNLFRFSLTMLLFSVVFFNSGNVLAGINLPNNNDYFSSNNKQRGLTLKTFNSIKKGMLLSTINKIIGFEGTVTYSSNKNGQLVQAIKWEGSDYKIITAVFVENRLTNKYMANLK